MHGSQVRLKWPFSEVGLPFLLMLSIFAPFLPPFPPRRTLWRPPRASFIITPWLTLKHFLIYILMEPQLRRRFPQTASIVRAQNIWLLGLTSTWAHNLFVLWAFGFPTVGDPLLGRPKHTSISSSLSLFLTKSLLCFLWVFTLFSQYSSQNFQPPIPHSHLLFIAQD